MFYYYKSFRYRSVKPAKASSPASSAFFAGLEASAGNAYSEIHLNLYYFLWSAIRIIAPGGA